MLELLPTGNHFHQNHKMQKALELPQTFRYLYCANFKDMTNIQEKSVAQPYVSREEKNGLTQELLHSIFEYKDGKLYWKPEKIDECSILNFAGCIVSKPEKPTYKFVLISVGNRTYKRSRLTYLYHHGYVPRIVDHEDRNSLNDTIANLRAASISQNNANVTKRKNKSSKYLGVCFDSKRLTWRCYSSKNGVVYHGKHHNKESDSALEYNKLAIKLHGEFANLNIISPPQNTKES